MNDRVSERTGLRVLIVDAVLDNRDLMVALFNLYGVETLVAASADEAIAILSQVQLDLLVSEIWLPDEDGYSLMQRVKALETEQNIQIPAIAVTSYPRELEPDQALSVGFCRHFSKPLNIDQFFIAVSEIASFDWSASFS